MSRLFYMKYTKQTFKKWIRWIDQIKIDLMNLLNHQQIYNEFISVANKNLEHVKKYNGIYFCRFIMSCYGVSATVGIRRHIKSNLQSISLIRVLEQMKNCAKDFTYDSYLKVYPLKGWVWQEATFRLLSKDGRLISSELIEDDIKKLKKLSKKAETLVDRVYAHLDRRGTRVKLTFEELEKTLEAYNQIACKYICFLTGTHNSTLQPTIQDNWQDIFTVALNPKQ